MFSVDDVSAEGFMIDTFWADSVSAGKKTNSDFSFLKASLEENGIDELEEIELKLKVYDEDHCMSGFSYEETITVNLKEQE
ncbi:hypothetical protein MHBO_004972 [Bonamia ostreae]|uniref:Uncharacterized protein n=1 Tax=Bonamia ostreae TaxID=126728 RepID=A0ABV2AUR2_9EUKA